MTPAERDEVRRIAAETIDAHTLRHSQTGAALPCACGSCLAARANLRYVPPGDASYLDLIADKSRVVFCGTSMSVDEAHEMAHAIHAAADAAEES